MQRENDDDSWNRLLQQLEAPPQAVGKQITRSLITVKVFVKPSVGMWNPLISTGEDWAAHTGGGVHQRLQPKKKNEKRYQIAEMKELKERRSSWSGSARHIHHDTRGSS